VPRPARRNSFDTNDLGQSRKLFRIVDCGY